MCVWDASFFQGLHGISKSASDMASFEEAIDTVLASMASARVLVAWLAGTASLHGMKALRDGFADMLVRPISFACQVLHKY